jgi:hypothetical protein
MLRLAPRWTLTRIIHKSAGRSEQTHTMPELRSLLAIQPRHGTQKCLDCVCAVPAISWATLFRPCLNNPG